MSSHCAQIESLILSLTVVFMTETGTCNLVVLQILIMRDIWAFCGAWCRSQEAIKCFRGHR